MSRRRSGCPIDLTLETFGNRWSLIILRDIMFGGHRTFRALLAHNMEGIASNILADRLARLAANGLLSRCGDPGHKQRVVYSLTEKAIDLVPMMAVMGSWGVRHTLASTELSTRAKVLEAGGPPLWSAFMAELRHFHLGAPQPAESVLAMMQSAYEAALAERRPQADLVAG
ncbi:MAG: transcriptional regulator, HxlR family [Devosia sp.]|nr:transcriptional regulator, HxlR family [Devosia sp.]